MLASGFWEYCSTCKQALTGQLKLRLAIALWIEHARAVETNSIRLLAADAYASALGTAGEPAEAMRLLRGILDARTRVWGVGHRLTLISASTWRSRF